MSLAKCINCRIYLQTMTDPKILVVLNVQGQEEARWCFCGSCYRALGALLTARAELPSPTERQDRAAELCGNE